MLSGLTIASANPDFARGRPETNNCFPKSVPGRFPAVLPHRVSAEPVALDLKVRPSAQSRTETSQRPYVQRRVRTSEMRQKQFCIIWNRSAQTYEFYIDEGRYYLPRLGRGYPEQHTEHVPLILDILGPAFWTDSTRFSRVQC
jgi:hypothetical protein